jgi:hypothetical protein
MSSRDEIKMRFESSAVFKFDRCDVAYGRLYLNDMYSPALRLCVDSHIADLPLKIDGDRLLIVEKAPYYVQIPPYQYITYVAAPNALYLISTRGAKRVFCNAGAEKCNKLSPVVCGNTAEDVYNMLREMLAGGEEL